MKKAKYIFLFFTALGFSQNKITLEECYEKARENYPAIKQYDLITKAENYTLDNLSKIFLPQISFNAQASYQTDVTKLTLKDNIKELLNQLPEKIDPSQFVETMSKDQYKAYVEATQVIYDGGQTKAGKNAARATSEVEKQKLEVNLYAIREKINQLYFGILLLDEQEKQLDEYYENLSAIQKTAESALKNGVAMQSDLDLVNVEILSLDQKKIELKSAQNACLTMLSIFIHEKLNENTEFEKPDDGSETSNSINRPEIQLFEKQRSLYEAQKETITAKNRPTLGLFVQGGYGRPGLNMLNPDFAPYAIGGVKFTWNFGNLYTKKNDLSLIENNFNILNIQEETFRFNTNLEMEKLRPEIEKFQKLMEKDDKIVKLRTQVKKSSQSKYDNGVYQMKDLISDINAENIAKQIKSTHYIQYLQSLYDLKYTNGDYKIFENLEK
ncbi:MAG: TolC family protein [Flavobacteriaceae bacterium]|jgi:outer membrane protein TolC|nr:TolC family protein [Flavobacteriaceae bacterium]